MLNRIGSAFVKLTVVSMLVILIGAIGCSSDGSVKSDSGGATSFAPTGSMTAAREFHTATLLSSGMVLIAGGNGLVLTASGQDDSGNLASAELYE